LTFVQLRIADRTVELSEKMINFISFKREIKMTVLEPTAGLLEQMINFPSALKGKSK
jgi:hypothetical protein